MDDNLLIILGQVKLLNPMIRLRQLVQVEPLPWQRLKRSWKYSIGAQIVRKSLEIASSICVYTNDNIYIEEI